MRIFIFIIIISLTSRYVFGQNLVPNGGFEEYFTCPQSFNNNKTNSKIAPHWNSPSYGTPDLYNTCSTYKMGIQNITGFTRPFMGNGFVGIMIWEEKKAYREYLQVKLLEPLKANHTYIISYRYKLSAYSKYSADRIGFLLTDSSFFYRKDTAIPMTPSYIKIKERALDKYTGTWESIETECIAKGGEQYLTIGNFHDNKNTNVTHLDFVNSQEPMLEYAAYYYIDDVSVSEKLAIVDIDTLSNNSSFMLDNKIVQLSDTYVLNNVLFDYDSHKLLSGSYDDLSEIVAILIKYPNWEVAISGHTDDIGSEQYNQVLSVKRTESVKSYLVLHGISEKRIHTKGYGKSKPIVKASDEKSRKMNRRVEVQFLDDGN